MLKSWPIWLLAALPLCIAAQPADTIPYNLSNPSQIINLVSEELKEISGLSPTDQPGVFCAIADEKGEIFFIDGSKGGVILQQVLFRDKGDFESVEMVGKCLYAMKSNGDVYEISHWEDNATPKVQIYKTALNKTNDIEGLGYDAGRKALLIACKQDPESDTLRTIFAFDLAKKQMNDQPVFTIDPQEVNRLVPYDTEEKHHFFSSSGVAVHPITKDVYVTSTALKRLIVLDPTSGKIKYAVRLNRLLLPQPEGISFDAQGNLYLSSEGKKGEGLLLKFDYKGK